MQLTHNNQGCSVPVYLDYDLISLSNSLAYSFEEGIHLASSILDAPFFITNLYDYVIIRAETIKIDDPTWNNIAETRFYNLVTTATNENIYSVMIPHIGKMVYYSVNEPTSRQKQLAKYIGWMISLFAKEKFYTSNSNNAPESAFLFYLLNKRFDKTDNQSNDFMINKLPRRMQLLACLHNTTADNYTVEISKICNNTKYMAVYRQKYRIFLFSHLNYEQKEILSEFLSRHNIYAGLSYPFDSYKECYNHASQAIAALKEAVKTGRKDYLAHYENLFALDVLYNYSSDVPLSNFRHPLFLHLEDYDRNNNSKLYITLTAYIENSGNTQKTAKKLSIHRNTVLYRLRQITEISGYDVQTPTCRASLLYAMTVEQSLKKPKSSNT